MSDSYIGNSEWEILPPAATYTERLTKKKIVARATAMRRAEEDLKLNHTLYHNS